MDILFLILFGVIRKYQGISVPSRVEAAANYHRKKKSSPDLKHMFILTAIIFRCLNNLEDPHIAEMLVSYSWLLTEYCQFANTKQWYDEF